MGAWADQSGNGRDLTQATGTKRPALKLAIQNGRPVVRFDGVDDFLSHAVALAQPSTVFVAGRKDVSVAASNQYFLDGAVFNTNVVTSITGTTTRGFAGTVADITFAATAPCVLTAVFNGANGIFAANGSGAASVVPIGALGATGLTVGAGGGAVSNWLQGDVYEVLRFAGAMSAANRVLVEAYLKSRWGTP